MKIFNILLFALCMKIASADFYSAIEELQNLSVNEEKLKSEYHKLVKDLEAVVFQIRKNMGSIETEQSVMKRNSFAYVTNPLNAFLLIKRLSVDVTEVKNKIDKAVKKFETAINKTLVAKSDFEGAAEGLTRLQVLYGLKSEDLANGRIEEQKYRKDLTASEIFSLGVFLLESHRYTLSLSYLELALERNRKTDDMSQMAILEEIYKNHVGTGNRKGKLEAIDKMLALEPGRQDLDLKKLTIELETLFDEDEEKENENVSNEQPFEANTQDDTDYKEFKLLSKACSGQLQRTPEDLRFLRCRYVSKSAFSKIAPFKLEEENLNPYIAVFHDAVSESEIEFLKTESRGSLIRAKVLNKDHTTRVDDIRTSKHSWHSDEGHEIFKRLSDRVADMTGLSKDNFEEWQTQNYGIGGHYILHNDYDVDEEMPFGQMRGNRIATMMLYLSDVERGGATVFPYLRIRLLPKKGTAVFWYNLSTSGHLEYETRHAACPVLVGSKWVSNKWIRVFYQERARPCQLSPAVTDRHYFTKFFAKYSAEIF